VDTRRVVNGRRFQIFWTVGSQMAMRLSVLLASRPLSLERLLILIYVIGGVNPETIMQVVGLGQLKIPMTSLELPS
jgi:hypothetical protein